MPALVLAKAGDTVQPAGDPRRAFCAKLRSARERRGIPLSTIAAATKVGVSHLAALERNDLSRWPAGIYRRAWIRSYADAVGLPADATVAEFVTIFDPDQPPAEDAPAQPGEPESPLRLTLATTRVPAWLSGLRAHAIDAIVAVVLAVVIAWATGSGLWVAAGVLALCSYGSIVGVIRRATSRRLRT